MVATRPVLPFRKSKCESAVRHFGFIRSCLINSSCKRGSCGTIYGDEAIVLDA
jgi:hypothetical protein